MPRYNIYLPDQIAEVLKTREVNVSRICQIALCAALDLPAPPPGYSKSAPWKQLTQADVDFLKEARKQA